MRAGGLEGAGADLAAVRSLAEGLGGDAKPLVGTSGTLMLTLGGLDRVGTEEDAIDGGYRVDTENFVIGLADRGIRSSVSRLPPVVHSSLDEHGFVPMLIEVARATGRSGYVGKAPTAGRPPTRWMSRGSTAWPWRVSPAGSRLHAVDDDGIPLRRIAEAIGTHLGVPTASIDPQDVQAHFGFAAFVVTLDNPTTSARTRELLDWEPTHPGLLADLAEGHYFSAA